MDTIKKKEIKDTSFKTVLILMTILAASVVIFIVLFISIKGVLPFIKPYNIDQESYRVSLLPFLFGSDWFKYPNVYSVGFIVINTFYVVLLASAIAIPISILTAIFIVRIAPKRVSKLMSYVMNILSGIPSVIYGLFGMGVITVFVKNLGKLFGIQTPGGIGTLSTILVLSIMIFPTITMLSITSLKAVKKELIQASLALGASVQQTNFKIVLRAASSGILTAIILGIGRALGEATAVSMVCGNRVSGFGFNLFGTTRTLTSTMLLGLNESEGLDYDIRFSVGIVLVILIILVNLLLNYVKRMVSYER